MIQTTVRLPRRSAKPRQEGLTTAIDGGLPLRALDDLVASAGDYVDLVKFGWGTALVSREIEAKAALLRDHGIEYYFGGTLFEKHVVQDRFDAFRRLREDVGCRYVEVSNGTIGLSNTEKSGYVRKLADELPVISEADGRLRFGLIEDLVAMLPVEHLMFEAPTSALQAHFVRRLGANVNLGNVAPAAVLALETLRLGLRADTLLAAETAFAEAAAADAAAADAAATDAAAADAALELQR